MMFRVITVISIITMCTGESPPHPRPQSNQAISSQSFVRHDVPLSYKYSWVHVYTTQKPDQYSGNRPLQQHHQARQEPPQIQYAPIYSERANKYASTINTVTDKGQLEPKPSERTPDIEGQPEHLSYVPGYNIELLQAVNRFPGHNSVYRSYPNMSPGEKLNKVNFLNQYVRYQNQDEEYLTTTAVPKQHKITTVTPQTFAQPKPVIDAFVPKQHSFVKPTPLQSIQNNGYLPNVKSILVPQPLNIVQEYLPHPKAHRMLLNIARTYNIAQAPVKAHAQGLTLNMPTHTQAFIQIRNPSEADKNGMLSVHNKNLYLPVHQVP